MTEPTDADRQRADRLLFRSGANDYAVAVDYVAAALAEERERARAWFLALAEDLERGFYGYEHTEREIADLIRRASEETP